MSRVIWLKSAFTWWRFSPGTSNDFTMIKSLTEASCLKIHLLRYNFTKLTLSVNMHALKSEREFFKWLWDVGIAREEDVVNFLKFGEIMV